MNRKQWEHYVGQFILGTGDLELALLQLHWNISLGEEPNEKVKTYGLMDKVTSAIKKINQSGIQDKLKKRTLRVLNECIDIAKRRNLIAHNPLYLDVYTNEHGGFDFEQVIRSLRNNDNHITEEGILRAIDDLQNTLIEIIDIVSDDGLWNWKEA